MVEAQVARSRAATIPKGSDIHRHAAPQGSRSRVNARSQIWAQSDAKSGYCGRFVANNGAQGCALKLAFRVVYEHLKEIWSGRLKPANVVTSLHEARTARSQSALLESHQGRPRRQGSHPDGAWPADRRHQADQGRARHRTLRSSAWPTKGDHVAPRKGPLPRFEPVPISGRPLSQTIIDDRDDRV